MTTITTHNIRTLAAIQFMNVIGSANNSLYFFEGRNIPWPNENAPDAPTDTVQQTIQCWDGMLFAKLITQNDISLVASRINWTNNTVYTAYTDKNSNLFNTSYYVLTSNSEVYKCLSNNNSAFSIYQPSGLGSAGTNYIQTTPDGYQWKYMLQVQDGDQFLNNDWFGVPLVPPPNSLQAIVANAAVDGSIDNIQVNLGGVNYANGSQQYIVNITGDGSGANAYANVINGSVTSITMVTRGSGYHYAGVTFTDPVGTGANATVIIPPPGGNGANAAVELGCTTIEVATVAANNENGYLTVTQKFRQNGLLMNPFMAGSNTVSTAARVRTYTTLNMSGGVGNYALSETVYQGININNATFVGTIIDYDPILLVVRINYVSGVPSVGNILYGVTSGTQRYVATVITPDVELYTGDFIEIDNEIAIQRTPAQAENFQYILQF